MKRENGQTVIFITLVIVVVFSFASLAIDLGSELAHSMNLQKAADAAALDGATVAPADNWDVSTITTQVESFLNTYYNVPDTEVQAVTPDQTDQTVRVTIGQPNPFHFATVFGVSKAAISKCSLGKLIPENTPFNNAIFSDQELSLNAFDVTGSMRSNSDVNIAQSSDSNSYATGGIYATSGISINGDTISPPSPYPSCGVDWSETGSVVNDAPAISMPDLSTQIYDQASSEGHVIDSTTDLDTVLGNNKSSQTNWWAWSYKNGTFTLSGGDATIPSGTWYFDGNVDFAENSVTVNGAIFATGTITISGDGFDIGASSSDSVAIYSGSSANSKSSSAITMDLSDNAAGETINGILYAPNGEISFSGGVPTIKGQVIGYHVTDSDTINVDYDNSNNLDYTPPSHAYLSN